MKIFNIINTNNYQNDEVNLNADFNFYLKPETSLLKNNMPFFLPDFSNDIRCNLGVIIKICKLGKCIKEKFAHSYYKEFTLCVNMFASDLLKDNINKELPWDRAVSFDGSTVVGNFMPYKDDLLNSNIDCTLNINNILQAECNLTKILRLFNKTIEVVSNYYTLKIGDFIIIETNNCNKLLHIDDKIACHISGEQKIAFKIK